MTFTIDTVHRDGRLYANPVEVGRVLVGAAELGAEAFEVALSAVVEVFEQVRCCEPSPARTLDRPDGEAGLPMLRADVDGTDYRHVCDVADWLERARARDVGGPLAAGLAVAGEQLMVEHAFGLFAPSD